jgi:hypothetical protein
MIHKPPYRGPNRWDTRDRYDLANAWRLVRLLQGALNRLPEHRLGHLVDLRDLLEKMHEPRPTHSKRNI